MKLTAAATFAAAALLASGAYAGSPYYDASGQATTASTSAATPRTHVRTPSRPSYDAGTTPVASAPQGAGSDAPSMASDGFEKTEADTAFYEHAAGNMGTPTAPGDATTATPTPVHTAAMPRMDADGFLPREKTKSLFGHAEGTMGAP